LDAKMGSRVERLQERIEVRMDRMLTTEWRLRLACALVVVAAVLGFATGPTWWLLLASFAMTVRLIVVALHDA
jgi:hypothetical protein